MKATNMFEEPKEYEEPEDFQELKKIIISDLNIKIGGDINELSDAYELENDLLLQRNRLQSSLNEASSEVPTKLSTAIKKAEENSKQIKNLKEKSEKLKVKVNDFLKRTEPLRSELGKRFADINKLEEVLKYLGTFEKIDDLSRQMKQSSDDEQIVLLYGELKEMCNLYRKGHQAAYVKEYAHYWHNVLKDKFTKQYEEVLKLLKWPFSSAVDNAVHSKEALMKFSALTRHLFLVQEAEDLMSSKVSEDLSQEKDTCLPVKILLRPLKKRFTFHFTGPRQTARIDRPEWFLTQTLTWIKDHQTFISSHIQPVADKLQMRNVRAVDEFNAGLIALAAERLHTVLALYHSQGAKGEIVDVDAAFAHAVDEILGFNRELVAVTGNGVNGVLSVLTKAETFVRWLAVEKKYALAKMDETLGSEQWSDAIAAGVGSAVGSLVWVPRGADWFISLLQTIEDRYSGLPQPGHRLQFLELQLDLIEEWRVRLTQLLNAALNALVADSLTHDSPRHLTAVINAAHHTRSVLTQWAHSLHYLQLHYYRRQFEHFTQKQHRDESSSSDDDQQQENDSEESMSLKEVELLAEKLALSEMARRHYMVTEPHELDIAQMMSSVVANLNLTQPAPEEHEEAEAGVFGEAPALLARLRDAGLAALAERILLEFKAQLRDYKNQKWHAMVMVEQMALSVSSSLCRPLAALCARLARVEPRLAPVLALRLRAHLAAAVDHLIFEEVVLDSWFNTGGTIQFVHDVKRNLVPAFAPHSKNPSDCNQLPKLLEACKLLEMDYDDARRLRAVLVKQPTLSVENLGSRGIFQVMGHEAVRILSQRTDLSDVPSATSVMELF